MRALSHSEGGFPRHEAGSLGADRGSLICRPAVGLAAFVLAANFDFQSPRPLPRRPRIDDAGRSVWMEESRVRLIGIDVGHEQGIRSPVQAVELVRGRAEGRDVTLEFDRQRKDLQGHVLAYVYCDGTLLNEELIRAGLARPDTGADVDRSMATRFRRAEEEARDASRGIWHDFPPSR